jgi:TalC/MipB family fructose-6-phosphate aldolase
MHIYGAGSLEDIRKCTELGVAGVLTNPQGLDVYYKGEMTLVEITKAILDNSTGPVFIQVHGPDREAIVAKARELRKISDRVNAKIIADRKGFEAIRVLQQEGMDCIATCLFSISQAAVAAMVGAYGICPFHSRAKDAGIDMCAVIKDIKHSFQGLPKPPKIFAVSLKSVSDVNEVLAAGVDAIALRYPLLQEMMGHVLTDKAEALFARNWANVKGEDVSYMADRINLKGVAE